MRIYRPVLILSFGLALILVLIWAITTHEPRFDGQRAYRDLLAQVSFGPRVPESRALADERNYIMIQLAEAGWSVTLQETSWLGFPLTNIISYRGDLSTYPAIIFAAHYDTRMISDQDSVENADLPVPGANDGASGVAVLLELARILPPDTTPVWFVFFDGEDNGGIEGREWAMGSRAFVNALQFVPESVIIVDMVGDKDLQIYIESNSSQILAQEIWNQASSLGYTQFINESGYSLLDDHTPFLEAGITAIDIIDFDYPYWHTIEDLPDKISPHSLAVVGEVLLNWLTQK